MKDAPRIFGQDQIQLAANTNTVLDQSRFRNDGDFPAEMLFMQTALGATDPQVPLVHIKPTSAPPFSKEAIPAYLLHNEIVAPSSGAAFGLNRFQRRWIFEHPWYLGPHGAIDIQVLNDGETSSTADLNLAFMGRKMTRETMPRQFRSPRVLWDRISDSLDAGSADRFDPDELRNLGDRPMVVDSIALRGWLNDFTTPLPHDELKIRIQIGNTTWTIQNRRVPVGALWNHFTGRIHIPQIEVDPNASFMVEIENNNVDSLPASVIDIGIFGSVSVDHGGVQ